VVVLAVSDNGEGIPPENLSKIFDPFFTTKSDGKGVGLGLAVSYGIIQAHGGDIEVKSAVGQGTTFTVSLPAGQPAHPGEPPLLELARNG
jgi:two-component system NtrC family sensor kinase